MLRTALTFSVPYPGYLLQYERGIRIRSALRSQGPVPHGPADISCRCGSWWISDRHVLRRGSPSCAACWWLQIPVHPSVRRMRKVCRLCRNPGWSLQWHKQIRSSRCGRSESSHRLIRSCRHLLLPGYAGQRRYHRLPQSGRSRWTLPYSGTWTCTLLSAPGCRNHRGFSSLSPLHSADAFSFRPGLWRTLPVPVRSQARLSPIRRTLPVRNNGISCSRLPDRRTPAGTCWLPQPLSGSPPAVPLPARGSVLSKPGTLPLLTCSCDILLIWVVYFDCFFFVECCHFFNNLDNAIITCPSRNIQSAVTGQAKQIHRKNLSIPFTLVKGFFQWYSLACEGIIWRKNRYFFFFRARVFFIIMIYFRQTEA